MAYPMINIRNEGRHKGEVVDLACDCDCTVVDLLNSEPTEFGTDEPRLSDHGARVHPAATNLCTEAIDVDAWTNTRCSVSSGAVVMPGGGLSVDKMIEDSSLATTHYSSLPVAVAASTDYCLTFFCKPGERAMLSVYIVLPSGNQVLSVDLSAKSVTVVLGAITGDYTDLGEGWCLLTVRFTTGAGDGVGGRYLQVYLNDGTGVSTGLTYDGDGASGLYFGGVQLEAGSVSTPLILTDGATDSSLAPIVTANGIDDKFLHYLSAPRIRPEIEYELAEVPTENGTYPLWTILWAGDTVINDGDMEAAGTGAYTANNATLTKETTDPYEGSQCLRITGTGSTNTTAYQTILTGGVVYRVKGAARGDGTNNPRVETSFNANDVWVGTSSTSWQTFDVVVSALTVNLLLRAPGSTLGYVEFDAVEIRPVYSLSLSLHVNMGVPYYKLEYIEPDGTTHTSYTDSLRSTEADPALDKVIRAELDLSASAANLSVFDVTNGHWERTLEVSHNFGDIALEWPGSKTLEAFRWYLGADESGESQHNIWIREVGA